MELDHECDAELLDLTESIDLALADELSNLCCYALTTETEASAWTVSIVLTNDAHIARLHEEFMNIPGPTDILTFADDESPGGDIVISVDQAERQRHDDGWSLADELRFLVAHGALHLAGWDDATDQQRDSMLDRQRTIVDSFQAGDSSSR